MKGYYLTEWKGSSACDVINRQHDKALTQDTVVCQ